MNPFVPAWLVAIGPFLMPALIASGLLSWWLVGRKSKWLVSCGYLITAYLGAVALAAVFR